MTENIQAKDYFKVNTKKVKNTLGMTPLEFARWLKKPKSTIMGFLLNDYKWKKWDDLRIKILILINGESISTSDAFRDKIVELGTKNLQMTKEGLESEKASIKKNFENYYKNNMVEKYAAEVMTLIEETYKELEDGNLAKTDEQKAKIKNWMEEKFPTVIQKCSNDVQSNVSSIDNSEKSILENSDNKESDTSMKSEELNENVSSESDTDKVVNKKNADKEDLENMKSEEIQAILTKNDNLRKKAKKKYKRAKEIKKITKLKNPEDLQKYVKNLEYAAKVGYKKAIYRLGMAYKYDTGVESDFSKAVECFFRAGKLKMEDALYELADCYRKGIGIEKSEIKAECLIDILRSRDYEPKSVIDISLCNDGYIEAEEEVEEFYENFSPKTEEERNLEELIKIWENK
jgi:hypothetical protein